MRTVLSLVLVASLATASQAAPVETAFPTFAGSFGGPPSLSAAAVAGDTLFLAGSARWAGPLTGGGVPVNVSDLAPLAGFPHVNGEVYTATADGDGGWFIGGSFTHVGSQPHVNLAHIRADLGVDPWAPSTNSDVIALLATPTEVYFAGTFTSADGQPSSGFAGVSRATGAIVLDPPMGGLVAAIASDGSTLFVGGEFTTANGAARTRLAAFRLADHSLTGWTAAADGGVYALCVANGVVVAGGNFSTVNGLPRGGAASLDPVSGEPTPWAPHMGSYTGYGVRALLPVGDRVYLGGGFTQMGGSSRSCLAAVDTVSGALLAWDPAIGKGSAEAPPAIVTSLELAGADVVAGGVFGSVGGEARSDLVRIDATTGAPVAGTPEAPGEVRALAVSGGRLFAGGRFATFAAARRGDVVAVRLSTGEILPWAPDVTLDKPEFIFGNTFWHTSEVTSIAVDAARVYAALSSFEPLAGFNVSRVFAYSRTTGAQVWERDTYRSTNALAVQDTVLYIGGEFFTPSRAVIAVSAASGAEIPWGVAVDARANVLEVTPAGLVVGGAFTSLGGQPRTDLAMLDLATGLATDWDPEPDGEVWALAHAGNTLYCGGDFANVGGEPRSRLAALALDSGVPGAWNPAANAGVRSLAFAQGTVLAGGGFTIAGGQARTCFAALNPSTGAALPLDLGLGLGHMVLAVGASGGHTFAAGSQSSAGTEPTRALTVVAGPDPLLAVGGSEIRARPSLHVEPQPARTIANVRLRLPRETDAEINLYDLNGRRLAVLDPWRHRPAGEVTIALEARKLPPGIYLVRATTPDGDMAGKLVVLP